MKLGSIVFLLASFTVLNADLTQTLDPFIEKKRIEFQVPGVAVSVVKDGNLLFAKGFGVRSIESADKVDENTIFQLASVTKTFTAAALAIQVQNTKLNWDEPVINYIPHFTLKDLYATRYANAKDLLAHRTGLPAFGGDLLGKLGYSDDQILYRVRFLDPATSFREKAQYSNVGYFLAGELLAAVTGKTWDSAVQETLLTPLKMTRSGFAANLNQSNVATSHALIDGKVQKVRPDATGGFPAAGAMTSTAADMARWMQAFLNHDLFAKETLEQILTPAMVSEISFTEAPPISPETGFTYALGWNVYYYQGYRVIEKGGALDGIRTVVTLIPELNTGITILANLNLTLLPEAIRAQFLEETIAKHPKDDLQKMILENQKLVSKLVQDEPKPKDAIKAPHPLQDYAGTYQSELYGIFTIETGKDELILKAGPASFEGRLEHWSNNTFLLRWPLINAGSDLFTFEFDPEGKAIGFQADCLGAFVKLNR